jgi:LacI family transcriptional regulator
MTIGVAFFSLRLPGAMDLLGGLSQTLDQHGYTLLIADTGGHRSRFDVVLGRFLERRVDALLCVNPDRVGPVLSRYQDAGVPAIALISRGRGANWLPLLAPGLEPATTEAILRLESLGHRRVCAMLPGGEGGPFRAVWSRLRRSSLEVDAVNPFAVGFDPHRVVSGFRSQGTTAVISTYPVAFQVLRAGRMAGISVPEDLSIVSVGDEPAHSAWLETPLSSISIDLSALGRAAAEAAIRWLKGVPPLRNQLVPASTWVQRSSTAPAPRVRD